MIKKLFLTLIIISLITLKSTAQSNPPAFDLSAGNYSFTSWDSLAASGTYPPSMVFQFINNSTVTGFDSSAVGNSDWDCAYNQHSRNRIIGLVNNGFAFIATSSGQYSDCNSVAGNDSASRFVGAAVLALNTMNRTDVKVSWLGGTVVPGNGTPSPRIFTVRLQYRTDTTGNFIDVPGPVEYVASAAAGDTLTVGPVTLPASCDNTPYVQLRWIYFQVSAGNSGTRPEMSVDEISVSSSLYTGIKSITTAKGMRIFPNPSSSIVTIMTDNAGEKEIRLFNGMGSEVLALIETAPTIMISKADLPQGIYYLLIRDRAGVLIGNSRVIFY